MWNYNFILPSLLIQAVILPFYFFKPKLKVRFNRSFLGILIFQTLTMLFDYFSSRADENFQNHSIPFLTVLNMAFFVCYILRAFFFFLITVDLGKMLERIRSKLYRMGLLLLAVLLLITLSSFFTRAVFYIDTNGYHSGPLYGIVYICGFSYATLSLLMTVAVSKEHTADEIVTMAGYNLVLFAGNYLRMAAPKILIMNTFCLMSILIIYLAFTNPDIYRTDRGAFNLKAFRCCLDEYQKTNYKILGFILCDYNDKRSIYGGAQIDHGIKLINDYLISTFPRETVFYLRNGCFVLLGQSSMNIPGIYHTIWKRFEQAWSASETDLYLNVAFVQGCQGNETESPDQITTRLMAALEYASRNPAYLEEKEEPDTCAIIDQQIGVKKAIETALETDAVEVFLQPLIDTGNGRVIGAEALCRIRDEQGQLISPAVFIPIAEKNGYISVLGESVFRQTCQFIHDHQLDQIGMGWINVNLSPIQCMKNDLAPRLAKILAEYNVDARQIHLEITEESMVDYSLLEKQIDALGKEGFQFALDDYGSGYSNLTRVKHYPFSNIKLDMELVRDYFKERDFLVPSLVHTFKQMGVSVTAEGIETEDMARLFTEIGCDYLQGFYYSKPLPMDEFLARYSPKADKTADSETSV